MHQPVDAPRPPLSPAQVQAIAAVEARVARGAGGHDQGHVEYFLACCRTGTSAAKWNYARRELFITHTHSKRQHRRGSGTSHRTRARSRRSPYHAAMDRMLALFPLSWWHADVRDVAVTCAHVRCPWQVTQAWAGSPVWAHDGLDTAI